MSRMQDNGARRWLWDAQMMVRLREMWDEGSLSASQMAVRLGVSRCAVLGKANRMKLAKHGIPSTPESRAATAARKAKRERFKRSHERKRTCDVCPSERGPLPPVPPMEGDAARAFGVACGLVELGAMSCRWPITNDKPHMFCNAVAEKDRPYCARHQAVSGPPHAPRVPSPVALAG